MTEAGSLDQFGWNQSWHEKCVEEEGEPGRVIGSRDGSFRVACEGRVLVAQPAGVWFHKKSDLEMPAVGDWVQVRAKADAHIIARVLDRRSYFVRRSAGTRSEAQVIAANVDTVFIVMGVDGDFNLRRLERYLVTVFQGCAQPVVLLSKSDLAENLTEKVTQVEAIAPGVEVFPVAALDGQGLEPLKTYVQSGQTVVLVGSSGAGKSTLLNALYGEDIQATQGVRSQDSRGRHTTTHRELFVLPDGALLVDTPGLRELALWICDDGFELAFRDIYELAEMCRFRDCRHGREPDCKVRTAISQGRLQESRLQSHDELRKEVVELQESYEKMREKRSMRKFNRRKRKNGA